MLIGWMSTAGGPTLCSSYQAEPPWLPCATKPRARIVGLSGSARLVADQPPEIRPAAPRWIQSLPLVETSKVVRQTSGPGPDRNQVILEGSKVRSLPGCVVLI